MSKYIYRFTVSTRRVGSKIEEIIDLVKDYNYTAEEIEEKKKANTWDQHLDEIYNEWVWNNIDEGCSEQE